MYDIIIRNAKIIDGTGAAAYNSDIAIRHGKIASIGTFRETDAKESYDAKGLIATPGFIDIHTHSDKTLITFPKSESRLLQGITTEIGGNCGISPFPVSSRYLDDLKLYEGGRLPYEWHDTKGFLDFLESTGTGTNFGCLAGHGSIRLAVMGYSSKKASIEELEKMRNLTKQAIKQGAFGMSTGLIYPPGSYADADEIIYILKALQEEGGYYATHMRNEREYLIDSVKESIAVSKASGVPLQISHHKSLHMPLWGKAVYETTALIEEAKDQGIDICCDQYPYAASATTLSSDIPSWAFEGGIDKLIERLNNPFTRAKLKEEADLSHKGRWHCIKISWLASEKNRWMIGKDVEEIGRLTGKSAADTVFDLVAEERNMVNEVDFGMSEEDIEFIMKKEYVMPGSDGESYSLDFDGQPHPRNFGTFPRIISHYQRERKLFTLEESIRKMTSLPARRIGIDDRGTIAEGKWADIVLFNYDEIEDTPTYENPKKACKGIRKVFVNGKLAASDGAVTNCKAGKILRK